MQRYGVPLVVAINHFATDTPAEIKMIEDNCKALGVNVVTADAWAKGGAGTQDLAQEVVRLADQDSDFHELYSLDASPADKVRIVATKIYGAKDVEFSRKAQRQLLMTKLSWGHRPTSPSTFGNSCRSSAPASSWPYPAT